MVLFARRAALLQNRGIKLEGDWFALNVAIKHLPPEGLSLTRHAPLLQLGLKLLGT
jgi:hypothetical protein